MRQVADLRAVSTQTSMNAAALVTDQHTPVHRGPARFWNTAISADLSVSQAFRHPLLRKKRLLKRAYYVRCVMLIIDYSVGIPSALARPS